MSDEYFELDGVECIAATLNAILVNIPDIGDEIWIPRSQLIDEYNEVCETGDSGQLIITHWLAEKRQWV